MNGIVWWPLVFALLCQQKSYVQASFEKHCTSATYAAGPHPGGLCQTQLSSAVALICGSPGNINGILSPHNKGIRYSRDIEKRIAEANTGKILGYTLLGKKDASSYLNKRSVHYETGIVCECCYHSCTVQEISEYCTRVPLPELLP